MSSNVYKDDRFFVLPNFEGHQVLLSRKNVESLSVGMTEIGQDKILRQWKFGEVLLFPNKTKIIF